MSDFRSIADAVREADDRRWRIRHYAPHPSAPTQEELDELDPRTHEQWCEDEMGYHGDRQ